MRWDHGGRTYAIYRNHEDGYFCTDGLCTHEDIHLADGLVVENTVECPKHSSIFNITNGVTPRRWLHQANPRLAARSLSENRPSGFTVIANLSASDVTVGKADYRRAKEHAEASATP